jgi:NMD protein affecting ribosome stability and mRNA decay
MKTFQQWLEAEESDWERMEISALEKSKTKCVRCGDQAYSFKTGRPLCKDCESKQKSEPKLKPKPST